MDRDASLLSESGRAGTRGDDPDDRLRLGREEEDEGEVASAFEMTGHRRAPRSPRRKNAEEPDLVLPPQTPRTRIEVLPEEDDETVDQPQTIVVGPETYQLAQQLAARKLAFFKWLVVLILANSLFGTASWLRLPPTDQLWFLWPLGVSFFAVLVMYVRVFLFSGLDLRTLIEQAKERMTQREVRRIQRQRR